MYLRKTKITLDKNLVTWEFGLRIERRDTMITFMFASWRLTFWYRGGAKWRYAYIEFATRKEKRG